MTGDQMPIKGFDPIDLTREIGYLRCLILGRYGTGKTSTAATSAWVPEMGPKVLFLDCGNSSDTLVGEPGYENIEAYSTPLMDDLAEMLKVIVKDKLVPDPYGTIIIDDFHAAYRRLMENRLDGLMKKTPSRVLETLPGNIRAGKAEWDDWGVVRSLGLQLVDRFMLLPCNLIICSLAKLHEDSYSGRQEVGASLSGRMAEELPGGVSNVFFADVVTQDKKEPAYILRFMPHRKLKARVRGRTRAERLGPFMQDPSFEKIRNLLIQENE